MTRTVHYPEVAAAAVPVVSAEKAVVEVTSETKWDCKMRL